MGPCSLQLGALIPTIAYQSNYPTACFLHIYLFLKFLLQLYFSILDSFQVIMFSPKSLILSLQYTYTQA